MKRLYFFLNFLSAWFVLALPAQEPAPVPAEPTASVEPAAPAEPPTPAEPPREEKPAAAPKKKSKGGSRREVVGIGRDAYLPDGEPARKVVAILGNATAGGRVDDDVVAIGGNATAESDVGDSVVAIGGDAQAKGKAGKVVAIAGDSTAEGDVNDSVVAILGNATVNGHLRRDVVAVMGGVILGPEAEVDGKIIAIGGAINRHPDAKIKGETLCLLSVFKTMPNLGGLQPWFRHALLKGRPLAIEPGTGWAWIIAAGFLGFYLFLALAMNDKVTRCAEILEQSPGRTILTAFLTPLLVPIVLVLLAFTVIGAPLFLFVMLALGLFGKAAFLAWMGRRITRPLGLPHALPAVLIGGLIITLFYLIPGLGFLIWKLTDCLGLGMAVYMVLRAMKKSRPAPVAASTTASTVGVAPMAVVAAGAGPAPVPPVVTVPASALPRAGFCIRLLAVVLDAVVVKILVQALPGDVFLPVYAIYCVIFWMAKGTTIGGIICGLRVVRLDERPLDWLTALVRALGGFLSFFVMGLGFIWMTFDREKQTWHDKIAGTVVVRAPQGVSLV